MDRGVLSLKNLLRAQRRGLTTRSWLLGIFCYESYALKVKTQGALFPGGKSESMVILSNATSGDIKQALGQMRGATGKS